MSDQKNEIILRYMDQAMRVNCDRNCGKAWGNSQRPRVQLSDDEDDYAYLADGELGDAPANPGTSEGVDFKPLSPDDFPNKWCVRECERANHSLPGESAQPLPIKVFTERVRNITSTE